MASHYVTYIYIKNDEPPFTDTSLSLPSPSIGDKGVYAALVRSTHRVSMFSMPGHHNHEHSRSSAISENGNSSSQAASKIFGMTSNVPLRDLRLKASPHHPVEPAADIQFSPDGHYLATARYAPCFCILCDEDRHRLGSWDKTVRIFLVDDYGTLFENPIRVLQQTDGFVMHVAWFAALWQSRSPPFVTNFRHCRSPSGKFLLSRSTTRICIWRLNVSEARYVLPSIMYDNMQLEQGDREECIFCIRRQGVNHVAWGGNDTTILMLEGSIVKKIVRALWNMLQCDTGFICRPFAMPCHLRFCNRSKGMKPPKMLSNAIHSLCMAFRCPRTRTK
jgi:hypothetical protein